MIGLRDCAQVWSVECEYQNLRERYIWALGLLIVQNSVFHRRLGLASVWAEPTQSLASDANEHD